MAADPLLSERARAAAELLRAGARRALPDVLAILRARRGVDFTGYRCEPLERRLVSRMRSAHADSAESYLALLESAEGEIDRLAASLTLKVSAFYRNPLVFDHIATVVVPSLHHAFPGQPLRVWSAGCGQGEEAWTLAMLFDGDRDSVMATDIDPAALAHAVHATYGLEALSETPARLRVGVTPLPDGRRFTVAEALRRRVEFLRHDLATAEAAPQNGRYHFISCRNVLIYFTRPLQERVMRLLVGSLVSGGWLCLGEAEWPLSLEGLKVVDRRRKLFRRVEEVES